MGVAEEISLDFLDYALDHEEYDFTFTEFGETRTRFSKVYALVNKELAKNLKKKVRRNLEHRSLVEDVLEESEYKLYLEEDLMYVKMKAKQDGLAIVEFETDLRDDVFSLSDLKNPSSNEQMAYILEEAVERGYKLKTMRDIMDAVRQLISQDRKINAFIVAACETKLVPGVWEFVGDKLYIDEPKLLRVNKVKNTK